MLTKKFWAINTRENVNLLEQADIDKINNIPVDINGSLNNKVDKVTGKWLSSHDYTDAEKTKLAWLEDSKFLWVFTSVASLPSTAVAWEYAYVDLWTWQNVEVYIWDDNDSRFIQQARASTAEHQLVLKLSMKAILILMLLLMQIKLN